MKNRLIRACLVCVCMTLAACAGAVLRPEPVSPVTLPPEATASLPAPVLKQITRETGIAAWYGMEYQGRRTATGEVFDMNGLAAAHRTLPLGTVIRVTNLDNSKSIEVTVTHRGPSTRSRIIDLSYGAARELGFVAQGMARVSIEATTETGGPAFYTVQAAAFLEEENAKILKGRLSKKFEFIAIVPVETNISRSYQVRVGSYASAERAEQIAEKLAKEGLEPVVLRRD